LAATAALNRNEKKKRMAFSPLNNILVSQSMEYEYFIQHKDSAAGYFFKKISDPFDNRIKVDSAWKGRIMTNQDVSELFKTLKVISNRTIEQNETLLNIYNFADTTFDSAYFHYSKDLKNIPYTLSRSLDSSHNSKLFKVELFTKKDNSAIARQLKDFNVVSWTVTSVPAANEKELIDLFERFKKFLN
jgi:cystathionine beta-lyase/cystathionine gamma-synthase